MTSDNGCYICSDPPVVEVNPSVLGTSWLVPLCRLHAGDGTKLLARMFGPDPELETGCDVWLAGQYEAVELDQGDGQG